MFALLLLVACPPLQADAPVTNGDFEAQATRDQPVPGWVLEIGARNGAQAPKSDVDLDRSVRHGGRSSVHLHGDPATRAWWILKQEIPVRPGGRYHLEAWTRTEGVKPNGFGLDNCYVGLFFFDAYGKLAGRQIVAPRQPDSDWAALDGKLTAQSSARTGSIYIFLSMLGDLWVDDLTLEIEGGEDLPQFETLLEEDFVKARRLPSKWKREVGATNGTGGTDSGVEIDADTGAPNSPRSLKLSGSQNTMRWRSVQRDLPADPGDLVQFSARVKASQVRREGVQFENLHLNLTFLDKRGKSLGPVHFASAGSGTFDWKRVQARGIAPEGTRKVRAGILLSMSGEAWFDDLLIERQAGNAPPYSDWEVIETKRVILRYPSAHPEARQMKQYAKRLDQAKNEICRRLEVEFPEKITVYLYADMEQGRALTGGNLDFSNPSGRAVHQRWNSYIGHEMVHVIAHTVLQNSQTGILGEGIAVWLNGQPPNRHHERAAELLGEGELPTVADLLSQFRSESAGYPASGSFCGYLIDTYGLKVFKQIYPLQDPSTMAAELVGVSFPEMEPGWHAELRKYR